MIHVPRPEKESVWIDPASVVSKPHPTLSEGIIKQHLGTLCQEDHELMVSDHIYTHSSCTLTVVGGNESEEDDIGGDMNHVACVCMVAECEGGRQPFSLIVKIAPSEVLVRSLYIY